MKLATLIHKTKSSLITQTRVLTTQQQQNYATYKVNRPRPITPQTPEIAKQNNPEVTVTNNQGNTYTIRHNEVLKSTCVEDQCKQKVCQSLCNSPSGEKDKAIAHFTTSPTHATYVVSNTDLEGNKQIQYAKGYSVPHEVEPSDVNINKKRTQNLNNNTNALQNIHDNDCDIL